MAKEKAAKDLSPLAKKGLAKFAKLSSDAMVKYSDLYNQRTGKRAGNIFNKEHFYEFVARNTIKK